MEIWRDIKNYEGLYQVSNTGKVKSLINNIILKGCPDKNGYLRVLLYKNNKKKLCGIHRLVAETYVKNFNHHATVNHIDGDKLNNTPSNLEYMSFEDNLKHAHKTGLFGDIYGEDNKASKLTEKQVLEIREKYKPKTRGLVPSLSQQYGVDKSIIYDIINKKTWKHI